MGVMADTPPELRRRREGLAAAPVAASVDGGSVFTGFEHLVGVGETPPAVHAVTGTTGGASGRRGANVPEVFRLVIANEYGGDDDMVLEF